MNKNCPNCGALYDIQLILFFYCVTSYFDLSALDLTNKEPFYLKIRMNVDEHDCYITQLVRPNCETEIVSEQNEIYAYGGRGGTKLISFQKEPTLKTNLSFEAIPDKNKSLMTIEVIKE